MPRDFNPSTATFTPEYAIIDFDLLQNLLGHGAGACDLGVMIVLQGFAMGRRYCFPSIDAIQGAMAGNFAPSTIYGSLKWLCEKSFIKRHKRTSKKRWELLYNPEPITSNPPKQDPKPPAINNEAPKNEEQPTPPEIPTPEIPKKPDVPKKKKKKMTLQERRDAKRQRKWEALQAEEAEQDRLEAIEQIKRDKSFREAVAEYEHKKKLDAEIERLEQIQADNAEKERLEMRDLWYYVVIDGDKYGYSGEGHPADAAEQYWGDGEELRTVDVHEFERDTTKSEWIDEEGDTRFPIKPTGKKFRYTGDDDGIACEQEIDPISPEPPRELSSFEIEFNERQARKTAEKERKDLQDKERDRLYDERQEVDFQRLMSEARKK